MSTPLNREQKRAERVRAEQARAEQVKARKIEQDRALRADLLTLSARFSSTQQREDRYRAVGRWHMLAGASLRGSNRIPVIYDLQRWFVALAEADQAISALVRLRKSPYPVDRTLTRAELEKIGIHRHIEKIEYLSSVKENIDQSSLMPEPPIGAKDPIRSPLDGWSWRPRVQFILDSLLGRSAEFLHHPHNSFESTLKADDKLSREEKLRSLQWQKYHNWMVELCRETAQTLLRTDAYPESASSADKERQARLIQRRREEYEWMRQAREVCARWVRLSQSVIQRQQNAHATYCVLYFESTTAVDAHRSLHPQSTDPEKSSRQKLMFWFEELVKTIKKDQLGWAYFKKLDWTHEVGDFITLVLLHSGDQLEHHKGCPFRRIGNHWLSIEGARIASPLSADDEVLRATSCFRIGKDELNTTRFRSSLEFLTLGTQFVRIRSASKLERFRCEPLQRLEKRVSRTVVSKQLVRKIRMQRGALSLNGPMNLYDRDNLSTLVPMLIDQWLSRFVLKPEHELFRIEIKKDSLILGASTLGRHLLTLLFLMNLVTLTAPHRPKWYPFEYPRFLLEPRTRKFVSHFLLFVRAGLLDRTGWYHTQPRISAPMLNKWTKTLARGLRHPMFLGSCQRWNETSIDIHARLHRVMVSDFAARHLGYSIQSFELTLPPFPYTSSTLPMFLVQDRVRLKESVNRWTKRLADMGFSLARIAIRIDVNPSNQQLVGRGLLVTALPQLLPEAYRLMIQVWQTIRLPSSKARLAGTAPSMPGPNPYGEHALGLRPMISSTYSGTEADPARATKLRDAITFLGLIPIIERFDGGRSPSALMVWHFDGRSRRMTVFRSA